MPTVRFTRKFSAAHRIANDPGICSNIHGHNYVVEIEVFSTEGDENGFIIPADEIKMIVDRKFDHSLILAQNDPLVADFEEWEEGWKNLKIVFLPFSPSTENLAMYFAKEIKKEIVSGTVEVTVKETDTITAVARA